MMRLKATRRALCDHTFQSFRTTRECSRCGYWQVLPADQWQEAPEKTRSEASLASGAKVQHFKHSGGLPPK